MHRCKAPVGYRTRRFLVLVAAIIGSGGLIPVAHGGPIDSAYSIVSIPSPVGTVYGSGFSEDAAGEWFGNQFVWTPPGNYGVPTQPVEWNNGVISPLAGDSLGSVNGVNASGQVVGSLYGSVSAPTAPVTNSQAFLYSNGTMTDLGTFGYQQSQATAISENGQIAIGVRNGPEQSLLIDNHGSITWVPSAQPNANMGAIAINNAGQVLGSFDSPTTNAEHAFLYTGGKTIDLGALYNSPNLWNLPSALSSNGIVVGSSSTDGTWHGALGAYIYQNGVTTPIPSYNGNTFLPTSVNAQGQVLGSIALGNNSFLGVLYNSATGTMVTLNSLVPTSAKYGNLIGSKIDDAGDIFAYSIVNGQYESYELTPNEPGNEAPVPEPSTWLIFLALGGAVVLKKRLAPPRA